MNQTLQADGNVNDESSISSNDDEGHSHNPRQPLSINVHSSSSTFTTRRTSTSTAAATASALLISASDKAGMQNIDRERINAILLRESGNSTFMQRQRRMDEVTNVKIQDMKKRLHDKDDNDDNEGEWRNKLLQTTIDPLLHQYQNQRRPLSTCTVIDMDGFFISCHILTQPALATIPAAVGSSSMISTSNYIARQYGVRAAMPGYLGRLLVEELSDGKESLTLVRSDYGLYRRKSEEVRRILQEYDPRLRMYSLDEAYMDIGPYLNVLLSSSRGVEHEVIVRELLTRTKSIEEEEESGGRSNVDPDRYHEAAQNLLRSIRQRVKDVSGLSCSAGLASNFLLAKVASDIHKPNGQHFVGPTEHEIQTFLHPLPCRKINGIGRVMEKTLRGVLNIETVRDLYDRRAEVYYLFKPATAQFLMKACIGYSENGASLLSSSSGGEGAAKTLEKETDHHHERIHRKGISHERTFPAMSDWVGLCCKLEGITHSLIQDLKKERNLRPKTITLKVKLANFDIVTKTASREVAFFQQGNDSRQSSQDLLDTVHKLLKEAKKSYLTHHSGDSFSVRLLGVRCSNFQVAKDNQVSLDRYRGMMSPATTMGEGDALSPLRCNNSRSVINPYKNSPKRGDYGTRCNTDRNRTVSTSPVKDSSASTIDSISTNFFECPICAVPFTNKQDNAAINAHVDACLNASTVKKLAKEETMFAKSKEEKVKKKRRLADFFNS
ncbi:hypothetical protein HJC23_000254 [Cyclotella cryptica]|uniref:DNA polymerase kappa n=1 Tax=Cyclotella cryptica TaxID=29204 RepID=A0ABD3QBH2_9STRA|eukprot:CCRYP_006817-RA/>CCRYP_006817-RA protein AED:0.02 eAED:0.02 QI:80/1/1/1/1/1/2/421/722